MNKNYLILLLLCCSFMARGQWEAIGTQFSNASLASHQLPMPYFLANTNTLGIAQSPDNGLSFTATQITTFPRTILNQNDTLYVGGYYGGVFRSTDAGSTVVSIESGSIQNKGMFDLKPYGSNKLIAASRTDGVHVYNKSTNTWTRIGFAGKEIACVLVYHDTLFAGVQYDGLYQSSDGGANWTLSYKTYNNGPQDLIVYKGNILLGTYGTGIKISADLGQSWQNFNTGIQNPFVASHFSMSNDQTLFLCGGGEGIFRYDELKQKWVDITANLPELSTEELTLTDSFLIATIGLNSKKLFRRSLANALVNSSEAIEALPSVQMMPNPCESSTEIVLESGSSIEDEYFRIRVMDAQGGIRYDGQHQGTSSVHLYTNNWPAGLYFVSVSGKNRAQNQGSSLLKL